MIASADRDSKMMNGIAQLREHGYRVTTQRSLVLQAVCVLDHATPETILTEVQRTDSGVNLSTVYRTLEVLEAVGLVAHAHLGHGSPAYHSTDELPHIHLVCSRCSAVVSLDSAVAQPFADELASRAGFQTDVRHMAIQGLCATCAADGS